MIHKYAVDRDPSVDSSPRIRTSDPELEEQPGELRMIVRGFDGSPNALWTLYGTEAKSYDDAGINTLKGNTDGTFIFVCSYSACAYCRHGHANVSAWHNRLVYFPPRWQCS